MHRGYRFWRWTARIFSTVIIALTLMFFIGEGLNEGFHWSRMSNRALLQGLCFPVGMIAGFIIGWWRERLGGVIAVVSAVMFYGVHYFFEHTWPRGLWFFLFALPGVFFLLAGLLKPRTTRRRLKLPDD